MFQRRLHVFKEKFKFSAAHFMIFSENEAERLHGHDYRVGLVLEWPKSSLEIPSLQNRSISGDSSSVAHERDFGHVIDLRKLKEVLTGVLKPLDEKVIMPNFQPLLRKELVQGHWQIEFLKRRYQFPFEEVVWLPVVNSSVEEISRYLAYQFVESCQGFSDLGWSQLTLRVDETQGQGAEFVLFNDFGASAQKKSKGEG